MVTVSVVIPVLNDAPALRDSIDRIKDQHGVSVAEIVISVGPSSDGSEAEAWRLAEEHPTIVVVENGNGRTPVALNAAIRQATGDVIVRVDARSQLPPDYIANALETMRETGAGNVGAVQMPAGVTAIERGIAAAMRSRLGTGGARYRHGQQRAKVETAYLGVFRRDALEDVGGYDEGFVRNQDSELNIRLGKAGHAVWLDPRLVVQYRPRPSLRRLASQYWQYGWWRATTLRKHPDSIRLRQAVVPVAVLALFVATLLAVLVTPWFWVIPGVYVGLVAGAVLVEQHELRLGERLTMFGALTTMHLSWGTGLLVSLGAAGLRRITGRTSQVAL